MISIKNSIKSRVITFMLSAVMIIAALPLLSAPAFTAEAAKVITVTATGKISDNEVNLRKTASVSSDSLGLLNKGAKLTIYKEIFTDKKSDAASARWYKVTAGSKEGYVRADFVEGLKYSGKAAVSTDSLNYRKGPDTTFARLGTINFDDRMTVLLQAKRYGSVDLWYKVKIGGKYAYVISDYVKAGKSHFIIKTKKQLQGKSGLAKALLTNPTNGGDARVVYTFSSSNCKKLFSIKGYKNAKVPQGLAYTGSEYHILYGMAAGQGIVTYSAGGKRLRASKFSFSIGHPNGITWDPETKLCYIFKGYTKRIYTWNPKTKKFGKAKTPYASSGVGYDNATGDIFASSRTGIRRYSSDGTFSHRKLFNRCSHGIFHYTQDCGAGEGFIFHGISGANKKKTNFIDIYRAADSAYLGSIKITLGEIESAVVGSDGYLRLLINTMGNDTDYIWKTPLNVKELK